MVIVEEKKQVSKILKDIQKKGEAFYFGSTALLKYFRKKTDVYNILTNLNIAELAQIVPDIKFDNNFMYNCYANIDGKILYFITKEFNTDNKLKYLTNVYDNFKLNPIFSFYYNLNKKRFYSLDNDFYKSLRNNNITINNISDLSLESILDMSYALSELDVVNSYNNSTDFFKSDDKILLTFLSFFETVFTSKNPYNSLVFFYEIGILDIIFPFLKDLKGIEQDRLLHPEGDVFEHTLYCFKFIKYPSLRLFYGLLFHDYGKSYGKTKNSFKDHSVLGVDRAGKFLKTLGYENNFIKEVEILVEYHMINSYFFRMSQNDIEKLFKNETGMDLLRLFKADTLGSIGKLDTYYEIVSKLKKLKCLVEYKNG